MSEPRSLRVGVDIGGTFTDLVSLDNSTGELSMSKSFTTPSDRTAGVLDVIAEADVALEAVTQFVHGTTTATNAVVERKGGRVGLISTAGFRDTLEIMRINRERHYDLQWASPVPLVPRHRRFEAIERVDYRGRVVTPLDVDALAATVEEMKGADVESIAVCFLFSFMNPEHEQQARQVIKSVWPDVPVSISSEILPEIREYERSSTVVIDAYVKPVMGAYFENLDRKLSDAGMSCPVTVISSGGGVVPVAEAKATPVRTLQSGPAGGVIGAAYLGQQAGYENLLAIDVGGTSFEVSLIEGGVPSRTTEGFIEWGIPFKIPLVDVKSIGAGGGSIARIDPGGLIQVGPDSAGSEPGPVCYGKGGTLPTLTDAYVAIGVIDPDYFLGGRISLDADGAHGAIADQIAEPLSMSVTEAALGVIRVAEAAMVGAMRVVSTQRGYDPRDYTMIAYGGAGPLPAVELARELGVGTVLVPRFPGAFCAVGGLCADIRFDFVRSYLRRMEEARLGDAGNAVLGAGRRGAGRDAADRRGHDAGDAVQCRCPLPGAELRSQRPVSVRTGISRDHRCRRRELPR